MPTLTIEGRKVKVDDSFLRLSPAEQNRTVDEIAQSLYIAPSGDPQYGGMAMNATAGLNEGLYSVLGAPVDLARGAINLAIRGANATRFGGPEEANIPTIPSDTIGGSEWIARNLGNVHPAMNPENTVADGFTDRMVRSAGAGTSMMIAPEAALGTLSRAGALSDDAVNAAANVFGRSTSVPQAATNAAVGAASGAGAQFGTEFAPDSLKPLAATVGGLAGGGLGIAGASVPAVARAGGHLAGDLTAPMREAGRERLAASRLQEGASDLNEARAILDNPPPELVPGSNPTTFQVTGDMGIGALERGAQTQFPERFMQRRADQNAARLDAMAGVQPKGAPEQVASALRSHVQAIETQLAKAEENVLGSAQARSDAVGRPLAPEAAGSRLRSSLENARAAAKAQERALWDAVDPDGTLALPATNTKQQATATFADMPASAKPPSGEEAAVYGVLEQYGDVVPFKELTALQSRLKAEMRQERLANGETPAYRRMTQLNSAIQNDLDTAIAGKVAQEQQAVAAGQMSPMDTVEARAREWVDNWYARQAEARSVNSKGGGGNAGIGSASIFGSRGTAGQAGVRSANAPRNPRLSPDDLQPNFDQGALGRLNAARSATKARAETFDNRTLGPIRRRPGSTSPYDMPASAVPGSIFVPGPKGFETVQRFRTAVGDPEAMQALEGYAVDRLRSTAMRQDGTLDPNKVEGFRRNFRDALRAFPELDARMADAATASRTMAEVASRRKATVDAAQKGTLGRIMGLDHPDDVTRAIGSLFGRQDSIQQISGLRKAIETNKDAQQGLRKAVADYITNRFVGNTEAATSGQGIIKSDQLQSFIKNNRSALQIAGFSKDEVDLMDRIAQDLRRANRSNAAVRVPGQSNTAQDVMQVKKGDDAPTILTKILAGVGFAGGGMSGGWLGGAAGGYLGQTLGAMRQAGFQSVDEIVADALLHPARAKLLLTKSTGRKVDPAWKALAQMYRRAAAANMAEQASQ